MFVKPKTEFIVTGVKARHHIWMQILQDYPGAGIRVSIPKWDTPQSDRIEEIVRNEITEGMYVEAKITSETKEGPDWHIDTLYRYGELADYLKQESTPIS